MSEQTAETEAEVKEKIVLALPRGLATIGDPTDEDRERVFDLEPPVDGEDHRRLELPADEANVAHAILRKHDRAEVLDDPTDHGLADVKSEKEVENEWARREVEKKEQRRAQAQAFDPAEDRPSNTRRIRIKKVYDALLDAGEKEAAAELRGLDRTNQQDSAAKEMRRDLLDDEHALGAGGGR